MGNSIEYWYKVRSIFFPKQSHPFILPQYVLIHIDFHWILENLAEPLLKNSDGTKILLPESALENIPAK